MTTDHFPSPKQRFMEALGVAVLTAAVTGGVAYVTTVAALESRLDQVEDTQEEIKTEIKKIRDDIYQPYFPPRGP